jgi:predicted nucleotidyltransferase
MIKPYFYEKRAQDLALHRSACVVTCNLFIDYCKSMGIEVVVFGSLVMPSKVFRLNSDVDLCVISKISNKDFSDIEDLAISVFSKENVNFDLWRYEDLKDAVKLSVDTYGVKHAR